MLACVMALGGYAAMSGNNKTFKVASETNLNQKIIVADSVSKVN
jgi:hypothetical protein